jgi:UDP-N-acetylglucosamine transferase subunit ALG13
LKAFARERPTHLLSTGSGRTALIPFLLATLWGVRFIYIDTFSRVNGYSKFGTFLVKIGHPILSQWEDPGNEKVCYIGPIFKKVNDVDKNTDKNFVFVTVGTRVEPFTRLIAAVDKLARKGTISEKVIVQAGHTRYASDHIEIFDFCTPDQIDELIINARYVITQESAGIGTKCLKSKTPFIVMPREYSKGELPALSDEKEDLHIRLAQMGYTAVVRNTDELERAITQIDQIKTGFEFDNTLAVSTLNSLMEESA